MTLELTRVPSPLGPVILAVEDGVLRGLDFADRADGLLAAVARVHGALPSAREREHPGITDRLAAYWGGAIRALADIPVCPDGTPFQQRVWSELRRVPAGRTVSYAELARTVGSPGAARAVGTANARNPIALVIPCHRVIGSGGGLRGYAGGVDRKRWLLHHEGALLVA